MIQNTVKLSGFMVLLSLVSAIGCGGGTGAQATPDSIPDSVKENGTDIEMWADPSTGLVWQALPSDENMTWQEAKDYCDTLVLAGHDDWRLPAISELRSLIRGCAGTETNGPCKVTDKCLDWKACRGAYSCKGCGQNKGPATGCYWPDGMQGKCAIYWSSSSVSSNEDDAWNVHFDTGEINSQAKVYHNPVRCVRSGG